MLTFIFGRSMCGKTETVFRRIKQDTENDRNALLIVPEQSTFDCERKLLHILGDGGFTSVPVLSFTRLCDEVGRLCGGVCAKRLSDCDRLIFMSRAVASVRDRLNFFGKYTDNINFIESLLSTVDEFKRSRISGQEVRSFADRVGGSLAAKLNDTALLMDTFDGLLGNKYVDPCDDLAHLERQLSEYAYFAEKTVYVDSFKNFTGAQLKILEHVISQADDIVFSFCYDDKLSDDTEIFKNVGDTVKKLTEIAKKHGVAIAQPIILTDNYFTSSELAMLERGLSVDKGLVYEGRAAGVTICAADNIYSEAEFAAREIRRLVREEGYRYRDFVIMARHDEGYRAAVEHMCRRYEVPCFTDKRYSISFLPLSVLLQSAMQAVRGFSSENIFKYLKTELAGLNTDEISLLENYVYIWRINGKKWFEAWDMSPSGLDKFDDADKLLLTRINELRNRAIEPLADFKNAFCGGPQQMAEAVWRLMEKLCVADRLPKLSKELDPDEAELVRQGYNAVIDILDSLSGTLDDSVSAKEFCEYFSIALNGTAVGAIPQTLDEVTFGAADRIKPREPKVCFMLGINQGVFPSYAASGGIIASRERAALLRIGMPIADYTLGFSIDEEYLLYTCATCAKDRVYFCYVNSGENEPSAIIDTVKKILPNCNKIDFSEIPSSNLIETAATAFSVMVGDRDSSLFDGLNDYFKNVSPYDRRIAAIESDEDEKISLSPQTGKQIFGNDMYLSATGIDTYFKCAFSYFCRFGLGARVLKPAEIDSLHRGTIVHYALEKIVAGAGEALALMTDREIVAAVNDAVDEFLNNIQGIEHINDNRFTYVVSVIKSLTADVVKHIRDDFRQNGFKPVKCELKISGPDADIDGAVIKTDKGSIKLRGAIDRVDSFDAYIRVVDYKTGMRKFRLPDVLYGLNMQMLLYLYAVLKSEEFAEYKPAGVLYLETRKTPDSDSNFRMNGIMLEDETVHDAMDAKNEGRFVSKLRKKKDGSFYKSNDFIKAEHFDLIFSHIEGLLRDMNDKLLDGKIPVNPTDGLDNDACKYCDFSAICGIENRAHRKVPKIDTDSMWQQFLGGDGNV